MTDRLRDYATSYEEEAWEDFEKFRAKKKRRPVMLFWRIAAGLLIFGGLGWGLMQISGSELTDNKATSDIQSNKPGKPEIEKQETKENDYLAETEKQAEIIEESQKALLKDKKAGPERSNSSAEKPEINVVDQAERSSFVPGSVLATVYQPEKIGTRPYEYLLVRARTPWMSPFIAQDDREETPSISKPLKLSVALASQAHQAQDDNPQQNFGLRGTTEIALGNKTELSTGLYFGRESLNLNSARNEHSLAPGLPYLTQVNYRWLNLEVPLNIRRQILSTRSFNLSTQAGVSVMGALGQNSQLFYENHRTITTVSTGENGQVQESTTTVIDREVKKNEANAGRFNLGAALNFSLGIHYPLGKNQVSLEPFFKYPVGSFTADKLHFSSYGVQLRWTGLLSRKKEASLKPSGKPVR